MNIGATVTTTVSTTGDPPDLEGLRKKDDSTRDPPSIMTDLRPIPLSIAGKESGAIRPIRISAPPVLARRSDI